MDRQSMRGTYVLIALLLVPVIVFGQDQSTAGDNFKFLTWAQAKPIDWATGSVYALLGLVGAMTTIFGFIGGAIPGTAGKARIDKQQAELDRCMERLQELISLDDIDADVISAIQQTANSLRDDIRSEQWKQFWVAMFLYAFLGAAFSAILADSYLQSLIIGAGWTAIIGTLGLKKDYTERKEEKDELNKKLINQLERVLATPVESNGEEAVDEESEASSARGIRSARSARRTTREAVRHMDDERAEFEKLKSDAAIVNKL